MNFTYYTTGANINMIGGAETCWTNENNCGNMLAVKGEL